MLSKIKRFFYLSRTFFKRYKTYRFHSINFRDNLIINRIVHFNTASYKYKDKLKADLFISHGVKSLYAANMYAKQYGVDVICDVVDIPDFNNRTAQSNLKESSSYFLNDFIDSQLDKTKSLFTVGSSIGEYLTDKYNKKVTVIPNYKPESEYQKNDALRKLYNLKAEDKIILVPNNIVHSFENIIEALSQLPSEYHVVTIGKIAPRKYLEEVKRLISEKGLNDRVHIHGNVTYKEYIYLASGADVGVICLDKNRLNVRLSYPNRLFDIAAAGLPIIAPKIKDIETFINKNKCGIVIDDIESNLLSKAVIDAIDNKDSLSKASLEATKKHNWQYSEDILTKELKGIKSISLITMNDATVNQRIGKMLNTFSKLGIEVKILCISENTKSKDKLYIVPKAGF